MIFFVPSTFFYKSAKVGFMAETAGPPGFESAGAGERQRRRRRRRLGPAASGRRRGIDFIKLHFGRKVFGQITFNQKIKIKLSTAMNTILALTLHQKAILYHFYQL
jgi:hypothetical protein